MKVYACKYRNKILLRQVVWTEIKLYCTEARGVEWSLRGKNWALGKLCPIVKKKISSKCCFLTWRRTSENVDCYPAPGGNVFIIIFKDKNEDWFPLTRSNKNLLVLGANFCCVLSARFRKLQKLQYHSTLYTRAHHRREWFARRAKHIDSASPLFFYIKFKHIQNVLERLKFWLGNIIIFRSMHWSQPHGSPNYPLQSI